jgi:hypothetical protein
MPDTNSWRSSRVSSTEELRELVSRFDGDPDLGGEDFAQAIWDALWDIRLISCSRVSLAELWFLLSARQVPDLPNLPEATDYVRVRAWFSSRMDQDPGQVPEPEGVPDVPAEVQPEDPQGELRPEQPPDNPAPLLGNSAEGTEQQLRPFPRRSLADLGRSLALSDGIRPTILRRNPRDPRLVPPRQSKIGAAATLHILRSTCNQ